eukprot:m.21991 g.21991  ORF g.21991 m.21991 type:complete len:191 (-) comp8787_c0_seq1:220-792(-)
MSEKNASAVGTSSLTDPDSDQFEVTKESAKRLSKQSLLSRIKKLQATEKTNTKHQQYILRTLKKERTQRDRKLRANKRKQHDLREQERKREEEIRMEKDDELDALASDEDEEMLAGRKNKEEYAKKLRALMEMFTPEQDERHQCFENSKFPISKVKKVLRDVWSTDRKKDLNDLLVQYILVLAKAHGRTY